MDKDTQAGELQKKSPNQRQWANLSFDLFEMILPYLLLIDLVRLSQTCRWFNLCVHNFIERKKYTCRFQVKISLWDSDSNEINNLMCSALPAWPCVMFYVDIGRSVELFRQNSLPKYLIQNLWINTSSCNLYRKEIIQCPAIYGLTLCSDWTDYADLGNLETLQILEVKYGTQDLLESYSGDKLKKVNLSNYRGECIPSGIAYVNTLNVENSDNLKRVENLCDVQILSLLKCQSVRDVSALNRVHTLNLSGCESVRDVSALGNVYSLNLSRCCLVTDVSALGNVHSLNLSRCRLMTDVSALVDVHTLDISYCGAQLTNISMLSNVYDLNLADYHQILDVNAFGNVHTLCLLDRQLLTDVSALSAVHTLNLSYCEHLTNVSMLSSVYNLDLSGCWRIRDVSTLGRVHTLNLAKCILVLNVDALSNVRILDLRRLPITSVSNLYYVSKLCIMCTCVKDVRALGFGVEIVISKCMTDCIFNPGQNIYVNKGDTKEDRMDLCENCSPNTWY